MSILDVLVWLAIPFWTLMAFLNLLWSKSDIEGRYPHVVGVYETSVTMAGFFFMVVLLAFFIGLFLVGFNEIVSFNKRMVAKDGKNAAQPVIIALESYKKEKGYYPKSLETLASGSYAEAMPEKKFFYSLDKDKYRLCFVSDINPMYATTCDRECYSSVSKQWESGKGNCSSY
ncbi:hypothetical protein ANAEL_00777 [Anaerolineales bacterium]|nr:hypothetical protein ANAEL_00777 [Anaerolineales bacterium]